MFSILFIVVIFSNTDFPTFSELDSVETFSLSFSAQSTYEINVLSKCNKILSHLQGLKDFFSQYICYHQGKIARESCGIFF